jgi:hypothetical protein
MCSSVKIDNRSGVVIFTENNIEVKFGVYGVYIKDNFHDQTLKLSYDEAEKLHVIFNKYDEKNNSI